MALPTKNLSSAPPVTAPSCPISNPEPPRRLRKATSSHRHSPASATSTPRRKRLAAQPRAGLGRLQGGAPAHPGAAAEHRLCRRAGQYRFLHTRIGADPQQGRRQRSGTGLDRRIRLDRRHPVRVAQAFNPPDGRIVNANNRVVGPNYPWFLTNHWDDWHRAARIEQVLNESRRHDVDAADCC